VCIHAITPMHWALSLACRITDAMLSAVTTVGSQTIRTGISAQPSSWSAI
jgi:hypothetical protein